MSVGLDKYMRARRDALPLYPPTTTYPSSTLPYPPRPYPFRACHAPRAHHAQGLRPTRRAPRGIPGRHLQGSKLSARHPLADHVRGWTRSPCPARRPLAVFTCTVRARSLPIFPCRYRHLQLFFSEMHFSCTECLTLPTAHCRLISTTATTPQQRE